MKKYWKSGIFTFAQVALPVMMVACAPKGGTQPPNGTTNQQQQQANQNNNQGGGGGGGGGGQVAPPLAPAHQHVGGGNPGGGAGGAGYADVGGYPGGAGYAGHGGGVAEPAARPANGGGYEIEINGIRYLYRDGIVYRDGAAVARIGDPVVNEPAKKEFLPLPARVELKPLQLKNPIDMDLSKYMDRDPGADDFQIYDHMLADLEASKLSEKSKKSFSTEIQFFRVLFKKRDYFLNAAKNDPGKLVLWFPEDEGYNPAEVDGAFHAELSQEAPALFFRVDPLPVRSRLNYVHNVWINSYLHAKKANMLHIFFTAFGRGKCIDARTEYLINRVFRFQVENYGGIEKVAKDQNEYFDKLLEIAQSLADWNGQKMDAKTVEQVLRTQVGKTFDGKVLTEKFVTDGVSYARDVLMVID